MLSFILCILSKLNYDNLASCKILVLHFICTRDRLHLDSASCKTFLLHFFERGIGYIETPPGGGPTGGTTGGPTGGPTDDGSHFICGTGIPMMGSVIVPFCWHSSPS